MPTPFTLWDTAAVGSAIQETLTKESVGKEISNLFPLSTPLLSQLEHIPLMREQTSMPLDTFPAALINRVSSVFGSSGATAATTSAQPEGATYTDQTPQYPRLLISVAEIQGKQFSVSGTARVTDMHAMADRFAYQGLKTTKAVLEMIEHSLWWSPGTAPAGADLDSGGGTYFARQTQGLVHWIGKSGLQRSKIGLGQATFLDGHGNNFGTGASNANLALNVASSWMYDAASQPLDDTMFKDQLMDQWWRISGVQSGAIGFCQPKIKGMFARFALTANGAVNERTIEADQKRITDTINVYETDFGPISLSLCYNLAIPGQSVSVAQSTGSTTVPYDEVLILIKPQFFKVGVLRPVAMHMLGKTGDFDQALIVGEQGLVCTNPSGGAGICNIIP